VEDLGNLMQGFAVALSWHNLLFMLVGILLGVLIGVLPGLGGANGVAILLPLTFSMSPTSAIIMLSCIYWGALFGGAITSILFNIPGEPWSVATTFDGYPMAQQGRAAEAMTAAFTSSFVGALFAVIMITFLAPLVARFALRFGPPEYFSLLLLGLLVLAYMNSGSMVKGLAMAALGLLLGMIGIDQMSSYFRFAYGITELGDGIGVVPVAVGLFGLAEILLTAGQPNPPAVIRPKLRDLLPSREEWRAAHLPIWRGTGIGFFIGIIPGSAHVISTFVSYAIERKLSTRPEQFGQGAVAGVAGPESANNAATSGAFVPMLALGVPGVPVAALLLAAMMVHGVTPGPLLIQQDPRLFWGFIASMYVGNVILLILNLPLVGLFVNLLRVPYPLMYPIILVCSILGVYAVNSSAVDVWIMLGTGVLGYVLRKLDFETAPIVLGLVLAPMMELSLRQSLAMSAGNYTVFVTRPISATLLAVGVLLVVLALRPLISRTLDWRARLAAETET